MTRTLILAATLITYISTSAKENPTVKEVSGGLQSPESVTACGKYLFVSNMGSKADPSAKDGDGYISQLWRKDGKMVEEKFISGLNSPKGIKVIHGKLFIADVDRVVAYNLKTRKKVWEADLSKEGVTYANDISIRGCGSIFVSATDKNAIYKVCRKGTVKQLKVKGDLQGANGLYKGGCGLYVANYGHGEKPDGSFGRVALCSKKYKMYGSGGVYDGIQKVCGRIVVTDWVERKEGTTGVKGRLLVHRPCKRLTYEVETGKNLGGPSDIYRDCHTKTIWIPCMTDNKLVAVPFATIKKMGILQVK
ncbi:MAG: hypothetical protein JSS76_18385 [Bacteroidetes bacterium]|nr:hypothetical protein [Bacteroidota bacterium]